MVALAPTPGVLIVENDDASIGAWLDALAELGARLDHVRDGIAARARTGNAVVVVGTLPPAQCAIALARALRERPADDRPRVVLVARDEIRRVDRIHVDAVLSRPFPVGVLVTHVRRLLALSVRTSPGARLDRSAR